MILIRLEAIKPRYITIKAQNQQTARRKEVGLPSSGNLENILTSSLALCCILATCNQDVLMIGWVGTIGIVKMSWGPHISHRIRWWATIELTI